MLVTLINPSIQGNEAIKSNFIVNVTHLQTMSRKSILNYLIKNSKISKKMADHNLISSQPRNFYLDMLLIRNYQLYYDEDQTQDDLKKIKRIFKLPLTLEIVISDEEYYIDCQCQSISPNYFNILQKIGEGTYAQIFLVESKYNKTLYTMKRINKFQCKDKGNLNMIKNQFEILQCSSKYCVRMYYQFQDKKYVYFILEYCPYGDLNSIIKNNKLSEQNSKLTLTDKYLIWIQIAFGLVSLHEKGIIYRDMKPENILVNQNGQIKICDFGFACHIKAGQKLMELCGSYEYLAPQMIKKQGYGFGLDIYCLGLLFYELLVGSNPFDGIKPENVLQMKQKSINFDKKAINSNTKDLLKKLLKEKPQERLGFDSSLQIFKHNFFKQNQDLVLKIIQNKVTINNLKFNSPLNLNLRQQRNENSPFIFPQGFAYNYLKPFFNVTENLGPKFNFTK